MMIHINTASSSQSILSETILQSFISRGESKGKDGKGYMYPVHWYGCWLIAHVIRESLPAVVGDPGSTVYSICIRQLQHFSMFFCN